MDLAKLTVKEVEGFASRDGVRRIAVENFLMSMGDSSMVALGNLVLDQRLYGWNRQTEEAIRDGISFARKKRIREVDAIVAAGLD